MRQYLNFFLMLFTVVCLSSGGVFVVESQLGPINTAFWRVLFSVPFFYAAIKYADAKYPNPITTKDKLLIMVAGIFLALNILLFTVSFHFTSVANVYLFCNFSCFTIIPASYFLYKEKITKRFFIAVVICVVGLVILIKGKGDQGESGIIGDFLAYITSVVYSVFMLIVYRVRNRVNTIQIMYYGSFSCLIILFFASIFMEGLQYPTTWADLRPIIWLTLLSQLLGQGGVSYCLGKLPANVVSVLMLMQPPVSGILAYLALGQKPTLMESIGILIVLSGIFFVKKSEEKPEQIKAEILEN